MAFLVKPLFAQLPNFTHNDCNNVSHDLYNDLQAGNAVILDFCARWCAPCNASAPVMEQIYKDFGSGACKVKQYLMLFDGVTPNAGSNCNDGNIFANAHGLTNPVMTDIGTYYTGLTSQYMQLYNDGTDDVGSGQNEAGIPFIMVILPNPANPANSTVKRILGFYENLEDVIKGFLAQGGFFPPPPITVTGDLCTDQAFSATLTSGFQGNILWSTNQTTTSIIVHQTGTYSVTDNTGCSAIKYVEFNHPPVVGTASISNTSMCENGIFTIDYTIPQNGEPDVIWQVESSPDVWEYFAPAGDGPLVLTAGDPAGTVYKFRVQATNGTGIDGSNCFSYSNEVDVTITSSSPTTIPGTAAASKNEACFNSEYTLTYTGGVPNSVWEIYLESADTWIWAGNADDQPLSYPAFNPLTTVNGLPGDKFRVKSPNGDCYALSNIVEVAYIDAPPKPIITGPTIICEGSGNVTLQIDAGYQNIMWSPGGQVTPSISVNPSSTTMYSVTVAGENGCTSSDSHPVSVMPKPVPFITATPGTSVCAGDAVTLTFAGTKSVACTNDVFGQYPADAYSLTTSDGTPELITDQGYAGEYSMVNVQSGNYYYFVGINTSAENTILTITNSDGSVFYATGINTAIWKATFTGPVRFYTHRPNCGSSDQIFIQRIVASSADANVFGTFSWSPGGATTPSINVNPAATTSYSVAFTNTYFTEVLGGCSGTGTLQVQVNGTKTWVLDNDNDNYYTGTPKSQCTSPGAGYVVKTNQQAGDCNDNNAAINPATIWYKDVDNDGYSDGTTLTQCTRPTKYKLATELTATSGDCNDNNATIHGLQTYYFDADKDGYGDPGRSTSVCSLTPPTGYVKDNTDCNDNDKAIHSPKLYYVDADHDGYGGTTTTMLCVSKPPTGYATNNTDCNEQDAGIHSPKTYYVDNDEDGYGSKTAVLLCTSQPPTGYSVNNTDCNDDNPSIHPNAMEICGNGIDDNCNGKIDENCTVCQNATGLTTSNITSSSAQLNWTASTNPVQWQVDYKKSSSSSWKSVVLSGAVRSVNIASLSASQTYNWRIKALCGKTWTSYSTAINFTTLASGTVTFAQPLPETETLSAGLQLYPNPNNGQFIIRLSVPGEINATAKIQLIDVLGRIVHTEGGNVSYGHLQKTITMPVQLTRGIYMTRVIVNDKAYQTKLIFQ